MARTLIYTLLLVGGLTAGAALPCLAQSASGTSTFRPAKSLITPEEIQQLEVQRQRALEASKPGRRAGYEPLQLQQEQDFERRYAALSPAKKQRFAELTARWEESNPGKQMILYHQMRILRAVEKEKEKPAKPG